MINLSTKLDIFRLLLNPDLRLATRLDTVKYVWLLVGKKDHPYGVGTLRIFWICVHLGLSSQMSLVLKLYYPGYFPWFTVFKQVS